MDQIAAYDGNRFTRSEITEVIDDSGSEVEFKLSSAGVTATLFVGNIKLKQYLGGVWFRQT
jgi:hypothetical protein